VIAKSSAYAITSNPFSLNSFISSSKAIMNNVGLQTAPYSTPLPISISSSPT